MPLSAIILQQKSLHSAEASHKYPCQMVSYGTHSIYCKYLVEFIFKKNSPFHLKWFNTELALISGEWMILQIVAKLAKTSLWRKYTVLPLLNCVHWCMYGKLSKKWTQLANFVFKIFRCLSQSQTKSPYFLNLSCDLTISSNHIDTVFISFFRSLNSAANTRFGFAFWKYLQLHHLCLK